GRSLLFRLRFLRDGQVHLAFRDLADGDGDGFVVEGIRLLLSVRRDLTGPVGHHVHQLVAAGHLLEQVLHSGIEHHHTYTPYSKTQMDRGRSHALDEVEPVPGPARLGGEDGDDLSRRLGHAVVHHQIVVAGDLAVLLPGLLEAAGDDLLTVRVPPPEP